MENIQLKVDAVDGDIVIRQGQALPLEPPKKLSIKGNIDSVKEYLVKRIDSERLDDMSYQIIDKDEALITVDEDAMTIFLQLSPNDPFGTEVLAKLEFTPHLELWAINAKKTFLREELIKVIKFSRLHFEDPDKHTELLKAYQTFDFSAMIKSAKEDDTRGNRASSFQKHIKTNLPEDFILRIPIFKGQKPEQFRVEICYDTTDASIKFWFESVELFDLIEQRKIEIFTEQLAGFQDFVIIRK